MSQAHSAQGADLSAKYSLYQKEVDDVALKIYAMKSETRRSQLSERVEEELEADPDNDTVSIASDIHLFAVGRNILPLARVERKGILMNSFLQTLFVGDFGH
jgi:hypothetical protein